MVSVPDRSEDEELLHFSIKNRPTESAQEKPSFLKTVVREKLESFLYKGIKLPPAPSESLIERKTKLLQDAARKNNNAQYCESYFEDAGIPVFATLFKVVDDTNGEPELVRIQEKMPKGITSLRFRHISEKMDEESREHLSKLLLTMRLMEMRGLLPDLRSIHKIKYMPAQKKFFLPDVELMFATGNVEATARKYFVAQTPDAANSLTPIQQRIEITGLLQSRYTLHALMAMMRISDEDVDH